MKASRVVFAVLVLMGGPVMADESDTPIMNAEIDFLLQEVGSSRCVFIRNGSEHDADAARDHLALKRRRGRRYFDSAEEFIERIASKSSWSGKPYRIRCDGEETTAERWFTDALERYRLAASRRQAGVPADNNDASELL